MLLAFVLFSLTLFAFHRVSIDHLLLSVDAQILMDSRFHSILVQAIINHRSTSLYSSPSNPRAPSMYYKRIIHSLLHKLLVWTHRGDPDVSKALLVVLGRLLEALKTDEAFLAVKGLALRGSPVLQEVALGRDALNYAKGDLPYLNSKASSLHCPFRDRPHPNCMPRVYFHRGL